MTPEPVFEERVLSVRQKISPEKMNVPDKKLFYVLMGLK